MSHAYGTNPAGAPVHKVRHTYTAQKHADHTRLSLEMSIVRRQRDPVCIWSRYGNHLMVSSDAVKEPSSVPRTMFQDSQEFMGG